MATLPPLPSKIKQAIDKPIALTTKDASQRLRSQQRQLSPSDHAEVLDKHQDYLDGLSSDVLAIMQYLSTVSSAPVATPVDGAWNQRTTSPITF